MIRFNHFLPSITNVRYIIIYILLLRFLIMVRYIFFFGLLSFCPLYKTKQQQNTLNCTITVSFSGLTFWLYFCMLYSMPNCQRYYFNESNRWWLAHIFFVHSTAWYKISAKLLCFVSYNFQLSVVIHTKYTYISNLINSKNDNNYKTYIQFQYQFVHSSNTHTKLKRQNMKMLECCRAWMVALIK